jgi:hypothetical protein
MLPYSISIGKTGQNDGCLDVIKLIIFVSSFLFVKEVVTILFLLSILLRSSLVDSSLNEKETMLAMKA